MATVADLTVRLDVQMPRGVGLRWQVAALFVALARWVGSVPVTVRMTQGDTVPMWQIGITTPARVWLDGVEVTKDCYSAYVPVEPGREAHGKVSCYRRNDRGDFYLISGVGGERAAKWTRRGMVRWEPK